MVYRTIKTVRISDIDSNKRMKFSSLMSLMQEAADEQSAQFDLNNDALLKKGYAWVLTRMAVRASGAFSAGNKIEIATCALPPKSIEFPREYTVFDEAGREIAYGLGMWSVIDMSTRQLTRANAIDGYQAMTEERSPKINFSKVRALAVEYLSAGEHVVKNTEIDILGHLNNIYYADMAVNTLNKTEFAAMYDEINISFVHEARLGEAIKLGKIVKNGTAEINGMTGGNVCFAARLNKTQ